MPASPYNGAAPALLPELSLHMVVAGVGDDVELLFAGEVDELHRIAEDSNREVGVLRLLGMLHGVLELVHAEDVHVQVMRTGGKVAIHDMHEVDLALRVIGTQCARVDGLGVGDTIKRVLVGELCVSPRSPAGSQSETLDPAVGPDDLTLHMMQTVPKL